VHRTGNRQSVANKGIGENTQVAMNWHIGMSSPLLQVLLTADILLGFTMSSSVVVEVEDI